MKKLSNFAITLMWLTTIVNVYGFIFYIMHEIVTLNVYQTPENVKNILVLSASTTLMSIFLYAFAEKQIQKSQTKLI